MKGSEKCEAAKLLKNVVLAKSLLSLQEVGKTRSSQFDQEFLWFKRSLLLKYHMTIRVWLMCLLYF